MASLQKFGNVLFWINKWINKIKVSISTVFSSALLPSCCNCVHGWWWYVQLHVLSSPCLCLLKKSQDANELNFRLFCSCLCKTRLMERWKECSAFIFADKTASEKIWYGPLIRRQGFEYELKNWKAASDTSYISNKCKHLKSHSRTISLPTYKHTRIT